MDMKKLTGIAIATAAAGLISTAPVSASTVTQTVPCLGVNSCKGSSQCKTVNNQCKGQNSCRGKGFLLMSPKACEVSGGQSQGGIPTADPMMKQPEPSPTTAPEERNAKEAPEETTTTPEGTSPESTTPETTTPEATTQETTVPAQTAPGKTPEGTSEGSEGTATSTMPESTDDE